MLTGFYEKARETWEVLKKITLLFEAIKAEIKTDNKKLIRSDPVEAIFTYPVITPTKLANEIGARATTASRYLLQLAEMGILREAVVGKYHPFANRQLLGILSE